MDARLIAITVVMVAATVVPFGGSMFGALLFAAIIEFKTICQAFADMVRKIDHGDK